MLKRISLFNQVRFWSSASNPIDESSTCDSQRPTSHGEEPCKSSWSISRGILLAGVVIFSCVWSCGTDESENPCDAARSRMASCTGLNPALLTSERCDEVAAKQVMQLSCSDLLRESKADNGFGCGLWSQLPWCEKVVTTLREKTIREEWTEYKQKVETNEQDVYYPLSPNATQIRDTTQSGKLKKREYLKADESVETTIHYTYEGDRLIKEEQRGLSVPENGPGLPGRPPMSVKLQRTIKYKYDAKGVLAETVRKEFRGTSLVQQEEVHCFYFKSGRIQRRESYLFFEDAQKERFETQTVEEWNEAGEKTLERSLTLGD